jgi:hypothetical protein
MLDETKRGSFVVVLDVLIRLLWLSFSLSLSLCASTEIEPQRSPRSTFKNALKTIPVPIALTDGVDVMRVYANGKTKKCFLTLSDDNFTLYVTSDKYKKSKGFFRRKTENKDERAIDIGAIDRIQRGHATHKFELARYVMCVNYSFVRGAVYVIGTLRARE